MSAWQRANGVFKPLPDFDWDEYWNPSEGAKRTITDKVLAELFQDGRRLLAKANAVALLKEAGYSQASAYWALDLDGRFKEHLILSCDQKDTNAPLPSLRAPSPPQGERARVRGCFVAI